MCVNQCGEAKDFCRRNCQLDERRCMNTMQTQAITDYESYARDQFRARAPLELQPRDFERPETCSPQSCYASCERTFHSCYEGCGGKVDVTS